MARLYEWERFLTSAEKANLAVWEGQLQSAKSRVAVLRSAKDEVRRKAVQRARNDLNRRLRAEHKEKTNASA
jgi:hypothetical protein